MAEDFDLDEDFECRTERSCEGIVLNVDNADSYNQCMSMCKDNGTDCSWITYHENNNNCVQFFNCTTEDSNSCSDCYSSQRECDYLETTCNVQGQCHGEYVDADLDDIYSYNSCLQKCRYNQDCEYFSYFTDINRCALMSTCSFDTNRTDVVSGEQACNTLPKPVSGTCHFLDDIP